MSETKPPRNYNIGVTDARGSVTIEWPPPLTAACAAEISEAVANWRNSRVKPVRPTPPETVTVRDGMALAAIRKLK